MSLPGMSFSMMKLINCAPESPILRLNVFAWFTAKSENVSRENAASENARHFTGVGSCLTLESV